MPFRPAVLLCALAKTTLSPLAFALPPTPPMLTPEPESLSSFEKSLNDSPSGDESDLVSQIKGLIDQLADQTPGDEVAEMLAEIERLKDVAARLVAENAVLKAKVEQVQRLFS